MHRTQYIDTISAKNGNKEAVFQLVGMRRGQQVKVTNRNGDLRHLRYIGYDFVYEEEKFTDVTGIDIFVANKLFSNDCKEFDSAMNYADSHGTKICGERHLV